MKTILVVVATQKCFFVHVHSALTLTLHQAKVTGDAEASTEKYETWCSQWARFSPAIVHRMLRQKLLDHNTAVQEFACERCGAPY